MRKFLPVIVLLLLLPVLPGCLDSERNPYLDDLNELAVTAVYPEGFEDMAREGVAVTAENISSGVIYTSYTDMSGTAVFTLAAGLYRINVNDRVDSDIFNASADKVKVSGGAVALNLAMMQSKAGTVVIKEIYCGGCKRLPLEGDYQYDKYVMLHNNDSQVQYLDGMCFGTLSPYNSTASNPWISRDPQTGEIIYRDFLPVIQAVWQFGGDGTSFPLQPGEDAVIALHGAIDHTVLYPLSVNLNKPDYFVCYNNTYFPNTLYHPAPGDLISQDRILNVVIKTGQANAYTFSISSPVAVLFRAQGMTIQEYVRLGDSVILVPGSSIDSVVKVPQEWVIDAVEVFDGRSSSNVKRLSPVFDAGYVSQTDIYMGRSLMRKIDEEASAAAGYEVLADTNNSSADFYEREQQSLHE